MPSTRIPLLMLNECQFTDRKRGFAAAGSGQLFREGVVFRPRRACPGGARLDNRREGPRRSGVQTALRPGKPGGGGRHPRKSCSVQPGRSPTASRIITLDTTTTCRHNWLHSVAIRPARKQEAPVVKKQT